MNFNIFKMSMIQNRKSFIVWLITLPALVIMGMAFYPVISESISDLAGLFENPMMKGLLGLFAMGPEQLSSLSGFYITYASIYVILIGGIFAALSSISDIAGEMRDKTAEFLLTRPVSRSRILISKWMAVETRILILTVVLCAVTLISFVVFSKNAPMAYYANENALNTVLSEVEKAPEKISQVWNLDDEFFTGWTMSMISSAMESDQESLETLDISERDMGDLLSKIEDDPESIFEDLLGNPDKYMDMFGLPESERAMFVKAIEERQAEYEEIKKRYEIDATFHLEMFTTSSEYFLKALQTGDDRNRFEAHYEGASTSIRRLVSPFSPSRVMMFHFYIFLFMTVMSSMATLLSVGLTQSKNAVSIGIGIVMVLYFISTLTKISPVTASYSWISPFGLIDQNITGGAYAFNFANIGLMLLETAVFMVLSVLVFNRRDI